MRKFLLPIYAILAFAFTSCGGHEVERNENTSEEINVNSSGESSVATSVNFRGGESGYFAYTTAVNEYGQTKTIYLYQNRNNNLIVRTNPNSSTYYPARRSYKFRDFSYEFGTGNTYNIFYFNIPY